VIPIDAQNAILRWVAVRAILIDVLFLRELHHKPEGLFGKSAAVFAVIKPFRSLKTAKWGLTRA
jgi:hypothetical protein